MIKIAGWRLAAMATAGALLIGCGTVTDVAPDGAAEDEVDGAAPTADAPTAADATAGDLDANGQVDLCGASSVCVDQAPADWAGPAVFFEGDADDTPPECSGDYPELAVELHDGLDGGAASCECSCGEPEGTSCREASLFGHEFNTCRTASPPRQLLPPQSCEELTLSSNFYSISVPSVGGGSCAPSLAEDIPEPTWNTQFRACVAQGSFDRLGCDEAELCVPNPSDDFDARICIYAQGERDCPAETSFSEKIVRYQDFTDSRACEDCTCGSPEGTCGGKVVLTHNVGAPTCSRDGLVLDEEIAPGECKSPGDAVAATYVPAREATCAPSTSAIQGELAPAEPTTFCCMTP